MPKTWVGDQPDPKVFFDFEHTWYGRKRVPFQPFAAKLVLPNDATVILMGDLHGDVRSLLCTLDELTERKILDGFKFRESKHYFLFLGDFTDRGAYGAEVLYTLFSLKLANPDRVYFARGNHEDFNIVSRGTGSRRAPGQIWRRGQHHEGHAELRPDAGRVLCGHGQRFPANEPRRYGAWLRSAPFAGGLGIPSL